MSVSADLQAELDRLRIDLARTRTILWDAMRELQKVGDPSPSLARRFLSLMPRKPCRRSPEKPRPVA